MELKPSANKYDGGKDTCDKRISINVSHANIIQQPFDDELLKKDKHNHNHKQQQCTLSPYKTHIVLQSLFNDMIGEFYSRTLLRLYQLMTTRDNNRDDSTSLNNNNNNNNNTKRGKIKMPWDELIQFYVHIPYGNKKMLDGHKLLLSGMLSNPHSPLAKSFVDLFVDMQNDDDVDHKENNDDDHKENDDGSNKNSGSSGSCQCYEKMVFCGYDTFTHDVNEQSEDLEPAAKDDDDNVSQEDVNEDTTTLANNAKQRQIISYTSTKNGDENIMTFNYNVKYTLWSAGKLDRHSRIESGSCGRNHDSGNEYECKEWSGLRSFLSSNFVRHYPTLSNDIITRRKEYLVGQQGLITDSSTYHGDTREFTVVGFTQRTYRRAWLNLPTILEACNTNNSFKRRKVICIEVNVENTSSPLEQLLLHRSLDVMIGVHGAQLTQAVLLPQHAHVLELLPWITDYIRGKWVQTKHGPTPLGVIFHNTDLK